MSMKFEPVEDAITLPGLRMVVVADVPSPWGEAAKGIFHMKKIEWTAVRLAYDNEALTEWAGGQNGPVAIFEDEAPRNGWAEILLLAERLAPAPSLIPDDPAERAFMFGLAHEIFGEGGLGWSRRLQLVEAGLNGTGGFAKPVAKYIGQKYGYRPDVGASAKPRVLKLLGMLAARLKSQAAAGSAYYVGDKVTAVDIYSAVSAAMFVPLPHEVCPMKERTRKAFETLDAETKAALDPVIFAHRDMMYKNHLALPLSL